MTKLPIYIMSILYLLSCSSCENEKYTIEAHTLSDFVLLDRASAQKVVVEDAYEGFFDKITLIDMALQMGEALPQTAPRDSVLTVYKKFIQNDVQEFLLKETKLLKTTFTEALDLCAKIDPNLNLPDTIQLIKTGGSYYGDGVFYTRGNVIIIPANMLDEASKPELLGTLIHEIFHIYSRFNPKKRLALYQTIGFEPIDELDLSPFLEKRILRNPDAVQPLYAIDLTVYMPDPITIKAVPIIYSSTLNVRFGGFFDELIFQLFEIEQDATTGKWTILSSDVGIQPEELASFRERITNNTNYIIHPEEIIADNFKLLALSKANEQVLDNLDDAGRALLTDVEQILVTE